MTVSYDQLLADARAAAAGLATGGETWFRVGYLCGQMEKVHSGACLAAVFRLDDDADRELVPRLAAIYSLHHRVADSGRGTAREGWVFRPEDDVVVSRLIDSIEGDGRHSPTYHIVRGMLCGITPASIDPDWNPPGREQ